MARYKKALSIYIKQSWIKEIELFAQRNEESVSEYIERAVNFQLIHDRKIIQKEQKEKEAKALALTYENFLSMDKEEFDHLINEIAKAAGERKGIEIAKTRWVDEPNE